MSESVNHSKDLLEWGVAERVAIKKDMDKLEVRLKNVNSALLATMEAIGLKSYKHELGTLGWKAASVSYGIDKDKLMEALLLSGLSADKTKEIMGAASKEIKRQASVSFTPYKGKDGDGP